MLFRKSRKQAGFVGITAGPRIARVVVRVNRMVNREPAIAAAQQGTVSVLALGMKTAIQAFGNQAPLQRQIFRVRSMQRAILISAPTERAMGDDRILGVPVTWNVPDLDLRFVAQAKTHIPDNHVVRCDRNSRRAMQMPSPGAVCPAVGHERLPDGNRRL